MFLRALMAPHLITLVLRTLWMLLLETTTMFDYYDDLPAAMAHDFEEEEITEDIPF